MRDKTIDNLTTKLTGRSKRTNKCPNDVDGKIITFTTFQIILDATALFVFCSFVLQSILVFTFYTTL